jgi:branched-subunit amino acid ABC-type transport system permease component
MIYLQLFILGLPIAGLFALLATGIVMVYRASRILNLAHGGAAMFTAYILYWLNNDPNGPGIPVVIALVLALAFAAALGWAMERFLLRPLRDRPVLVSVIMTVGVLALLTALAGQFWGYDRQNAPHIIPAVTQLRFLDIAVGVDRLLILAITAGLMVGVIYLFRNTTLGISMRAVSDDRRAALLMGVPADRVSTLTWVLGSVLAGAAGILLSPIIGLQPINLTLLAIPAYAAALFGGLTSIPLTLTGAALVGLIFSEVPELPGISTSSFPGARELVIFGTVILFLFFRWQRLFGGELQEEEI